MNQRNAFTQFTAKHLRLSLTVGLFMLFLAVLLPASVDARHSETDFQSQPTSVSLQANLPTGVTGEILLKIDDEVQFPIDPETALRLSLVIADAATNGERIAEEIFVEADGRFSALNLGAGEYLVTLNNYSSFGVVGEESLSVSLQDGDIFQIDFLLKPSVLERSVNAAAIEDALPTGVSGEITVKVDSDISFPVDAQTSANLSVIVVDAETTGELYSERLTLDENGRFSTWNALAGDHLVILQNRTELAADAEQYAVLLNPGDIVEIDFELTVPESNASTTNRSPDSAAPEALFDSRNTIFLPFVNSGESFNELSQEIREIVRAANMVPCPPSIPCSQGMPFTVVASSSVPGVVTMVSPSGSTTNNPPAFTWTKESSATEYRVVVYDKSTSPWTVVLNSVYSDAAVCSGTTCAITPTGLVLNQTSHLWNIRGQNSSGNGPYAGGLNFTIGSGGNPPGVVTMVSPSGSTTSNPPAFTWTKESSATEYRVVVYDKSTSPWTVVLNSVYSDATACSGATCAITPTGLVLNQTNHLWNIRGQNSSGNGPYAGGLNFTIE